MPEKSKWKNKCFNASFDDPSRKCEKRTKTEPQPQSGILSILGKNIGLLSRKHNRDSQNKYRQEPPEEKTAKIKISKLLKFPKPKENKINSTCQTKISEKKKIPGDKKKLSSPPENSQTKRQGKNPKSKSSNVKESNEWNNAVLKKPCDGEKCLTNKNSGQKKKFRQQEVQKSNNTKSNNIDQKLQKSKLRKSKSDSALNEKKRRPLRANSAQSRRSSSGTVTARTSTTSSKGGTPTTHKKTKKPLEKIKKKVESPASNESTQPVVYVNYRYQVNIETAAPCLSVERSSFQN